MSTFSVLAAPFASSSRLALLFARVLSVSAVALFAGALASCSADAPGVTPTTAAAKGQLTMKIDGVPWVAEGKVSGAVSSGVIAVGGDLDAAGSEQLTINVYQTAPGTYVLDKAAKAKDGSIVTFNKKGDFYSSDITTSKLTVVITKASGLEVEGTFSGTFEEAQAGAGGTLAKKIVITEGKFVTK